MSSFLGPVHNWLFYKIKLQNELTLDVISLDKNNSLQLRTDLEEKYGFMPEGDLAEIIDDENIHGWLQSFVSQTEYKLAESVTTLIKKDAKIIKNIKEIFYNKGIAVSENKIKDTASDIYKIISDSLLDGMPCDHANVLLEEQDDKVVWKRNLCVHTKYWEEVGGNMEYYYSLREELIKGILAGTVFIYENVEDSIYSIRK